MDLNQKLAGVVWSIKASVRADEDVPKSESVSVILDIDYSECTVADVLAFASADRRIAWQASARKAVGRLEDGQHVAVRAKSPGKKSVDTIADLMALAKVAGMTIQEYVLAEVAKRSK